MIGKLRGRTVFITGAARGIGEAVARQAAAGGARVFLAGLEPDRLAALAAELGGGWATCDVTDQTALAAAVEVAAFSALPGMTAYCAAKAGVEHFGNALRLELAVDGVAVGTAHPGWVDTDLVRDAQAELPSFRASLAKLPWPVNRTVPVRECARALVAGIERRQRRVYVPRAVGLLQSLRSVVNGRVAQAVLQRPARAVVALMESEVRAVGRSFGEHSMGLGGRPRSEPTNADHL